MSPVTLMACVLDCKALIVRLFRSHSEAIEIFSVKYYKRLIEIHVAHTPHSKRS